VARAGNGAQKLRRFDVVVVGDGDQRGAVEFALDLAAFQVKGEARRERRRPPGARIVQLHDGVLRVDTFAGAKEASPEAVARDGLHDEIECLSGAVGVAVQRDAGVETARGIRILPQVRDLGSLHGQLLRPAWSV
jgi:hypothetical protein